MIDAYAHLDIAQPDPAQDLRERIRDGGVERAVVVETWDGRNRAWIRQLIDQYPAECCGVICFRQGCADLVSECLTNAKVIGLRIRTADLVSSEAMVASLEESGKWLVVHAEAGIGVLRESLISLAARHPHLRIYVPHLGWPRQAGQEDPVWRAAMCDLAAVPGCIAGISAIATFSNEQYPHADVREFAAQLCEMFGADRLVLGSDYPLFERGGYSIYMHLARDWFQLLTGRDRAVAEQELCAETKRGSD